MLSYIFILHQTTTLSHIQQLCLLLSYIFILHQTTTTLMFTFLPFMLSYIFILHQTTTTKRRMSPSRRCLISSFYIKPQHCISSNRQVSVVLYLHSTSNHNSKSERFKAMRVVLYLHSTSNHNSCSWFLPVRAVVLYLHSTSNHNIYYVYICYSIY